MSRAGEPQGTSSGQQNATDAEFRAAFSLLPQINNILTSVGQSDRSAVEKAIGELEAELCRCQQLLNGCSFLEISPEEQKAILECKKQLLQQRSELLVSYTDLAVIVSR